MYFQVRGKAKQLCTGEPLPDYHFAALVETNKVKDCLAEIDANYVYLHGMPPRSPLYPQVDRSQKRRTIPLVTPKKQGKIRPRGVRAHSMCKRGCNSTFTKRGK